MTPGQQRLYARTVWLPTLTWNYILGRVLKLRRWSDRIDEHVIVGAYPFARDVPRLVSEGVKGVVNTCEEYAGPSIRYEAAGIEQLRIPTTDFAHPRLEDVKLAVEFVQKHVEAGESVYIHCKAGRARSATVALCWLIKYRGMSVDGAQKLLLQKRPHVNRRLAERPVVRQFIEDLEDRLESA